MKFFITPIIAALLIFCMISCAGAPQDGTSTMSDGSGAIIESEAVQSTSEVIWKPDLEEIKFIDGTIDKLVEYRYDEDGRILEIAEKDSRNEPLNIRTYKYESGVLIEQTMSDQFGPVSITRYENDSVGNPLREVKQDAKGLVLSVVSYTYDDGRVTESIAADGQGTPHLIARYTYDGNFVIQVDYLLPGGKEEARFERTLMGGRPVEEKTILPDGSVETARSFTYQGDLLVEEIHYAGSMKLKSVRYDFDGNGNIIRETWSNKTGREYEIVERRWQRFELGK